MRTLATIAATIIMIRVMLIIIDRNVNTDDFESSNDIIEASLIFLLIE